MKNIIDLYAARKTAANNGGLFSNPGLSFTGEKFIGGLPENGGATPYNNYYLRQNARNAVQKSTVASTIATRSADLVADVGLRFYSNPDSKGLNLDKNKALEISQIITRNFHNFCLSKKQHRCELMNFYQSQRHYQRARVMDGEVFVRLYYTKQDDLINPVQFSFIDPNQIRGDALSGTQIPNNSDDGIVRDSRGRATGYKIWVHNSNRGIVSYTIPAKSVGGRKPYILHGFVVELVGQKRGVSSLGRFAQDFNNIEEFIQAQTKKAINQSNLFMYAENQMQDPSNPVEDFALGSAGFTNNTPESDASASKIERPELLTQTPQMPIIKPGSLAFFNLTQGDKLKPFPNTAPSEGFESFIDCYAGMLSISHGMPKSIYKMEFSNNYSASRAELLLFWRTINIERAEMVSDYCNIILEQFLSEEIASGKLSLPGWQDPRIKALWMSGVWYGSSVPTIDPKKEAEASMLNLQMSTTTVDRVARDLNGSDADSNMVKNTDIFPNLPQPYWYTKENVNTNIQIEEGGLE